MSQSPSIFRGFKPWAIFTVVVLGIALLAYGCELAQARLRHVGLLPTLTSVPTITRTPTPLPTSTRAPTPAPPPTLTPTGTPMPTATPSFTATPIPPPAAAPTDERPIVTLLIDPVPVRFGPGDNYKIIWQATRADDIRLVSDPGGTPWLIIAKGDQTGWVKKNSVRVGDATPEPIPAAPSSAVSTYATEMSQHIQDIGGALQALGDLTRDPDLGNTDWKINVATQMAIIRVSHQRLTEMDVPPEMADIHAAVLDATIDCDQAMLYMADGIDKFSTEDLQTAANLIASCGKKTAIPMAMIKTYQAQK